MAEKMPPRLSPCLPLSVSPCRTRSASARRTYGVIPLEKHEMLPGQLVELLDQLESVGWEFLHDLGLGHFVEWLDRHLGIFGAELHQCNTALWFEAFSDCCQHLLGIRELVVNIDQ